LTYDEKEKQKEHKDFEDIEEYNKYVKNAKNKTFWANFVDLIKDGFFFGDKVLMGSFAENIIWKVADLERDEIFTKSKLFDINLELKNENLEYDKKQKLEKEKEDLEKKLKEIENKIWISKELWIKEKMWDDFVKNNLLYFIWK